MNSGIAREIFEGLPAPSLIVDGDVRVVSANGAARALFGEACDGGRLLARGSGDLLGCIHASGPGGCGRQQHCAGCVIRGSVQHALSRGSVRRVRTFMEVRGPSGDPTEICVLVSATPLRGAAADRVLLSLENVSDLELKAEILRAEDARRRADARADALARFPEENPDPVLRVDADGTLLYANAAGLTALAGLRLAVGRPVPPSLAAPARAALAGGRRVTSELSSGGRVYELSFSGADDVNVYGRDVTDRKRAVEALAAEKERLAAMQQALRESEQRIRVKLNAILSPDGDLGALELADIIDADALRALMVEFNALTRIPLAVIDVRGKVLVGVGWSDVCTRFHRAHPDTCRHCLDSDTELSADIPPGEIRIYRCKNNMWDVATPIAIGGHHLGSVFMGQFFFEDEPIDDELFRAQARRYGFDEAEYMAALHAAPRLCRSAVASAMTFFLRLAEMLSRASLGNLKLARAAAERERLLEQLRESKERLEHDDRRKNEFLAVLSHELRNPLAPVRNALHILEHPEATPAQARRAREIAGRQVAHLTRLVDDLLDVTRIVRGKIDLRRTRLDLGELARRAAEDYRPLMEAQRIRLDVDAPHEPAWVHGDEIRLAQVVGNLLQNAAKFTAEGGHVALSVTATEGAVEIAVRDDGSGIDPSLLERIFEPFVQAKQSLARTEGGLGLGLALVKGLVELHGGTVRVRSGGIGQGAEFTIRLPAGAATDAGAGARVGAIEERTARRVLVVDDNPDAAESLADLVRLFGHDAIVVYDAESALERVRASAPDVVLCDLGLPGMSGYELATALRADRRFDGVQLVAVSGHAHADDQARALAAGFAEHVAKPPDPDRLEELLSRATRP